MAVLALNPVPIYEFRCPKGHQFEVFHKMADPDPEVCEVCGASPLVKVLHPVPVHFKGSGFYSTEYGRGGRKRDSSSDGDDGAKKDESVKKIEKSEKSEKTEKKPAAKES